jgi:Family of unknown function (DUF6152)
MLNAEYVPLGVGAVRDLLLVNPHSWLHVDMKGEDGRVTTWRCELRGGGAIKAAAKWHG